MKTYVCSVYRKEKFYTEGMVQFKEGAFHAIQRDTKPYASLEDAKAATLARFKSGQQWIHVHHEHKWNEIRNEEWLPEAQHFHRKEFTGSLDAHCMVIYHMLVTEVQTEEAAAY